IVSHPSYPWVPGGAKIFTRDFLSLARARLRPAGVYVQPFQLFYIGYTGIQAMLRTFADVFPNSLVMLSGRAAGEVILFGSDEPVKIDWRSLNLPYSAEERAMDLAALRIGPGALVARVLFGTSELPAIAAPAPVSTDDNRRLEFLALANLY